MAVFSSKCNLGQIYKSLIFKKIKNLFYKFVFLSYHGNNFYCTLTQIKIYGVTMLVDFRNDFSKNFNKTEFELNKIIKNRTLNLIKEEKADKNRFQTKINKKYEKNLPEDLYLFII